MNDLNKLLNTQDEVKKLQVQQENLIKQNSDMQKETAKLESESDKRIAQSLQEFTTETNATKKELRLREEGVKKGEQEIADIEKAREALKSKEASLTRRGSALALKEKEIDTLRASLSNKELLADLRTEQATKLLEEKGVKPKELPKKEVKKEKKDKK